MTEMICKDGSSAVQNLPGTNQGMQPRARSAPFNMSLLALCALFLQGTAEAACSTEDRAVFARSGYSKTEIESMCQKNAGAQKRNAVLAEAIAADELGAYVTAMKLLLPLAEQGNPEAQLRIGMRYLNGQGVAASEAESDRWFRKAAAGFRAADQRDEPASLARLAGMHDNGLGMEENDEEAERLYRRAAEFYRAAAQRGEAEAQHALGNLHEKGLGVERDQEVAFEWQHKAANQGHPGAQFKLGYAYEHGEGVQWNEQEAKKWYRKAAERGHPEAMNRLAHVHRTKVEGSMFDTKLTGEALKWYIWAAERGHVDMQLSLARIYAEGEPPAKKNVAEATKWFRKAIEQGHTDGYLGLVDMYMQGTPSNVTEAFRLYQELAKLDNGLAGDALSRMWRHAAVLDDTAALRYLIGAGPDARAHASEVLYSAVASNSLKSATLLLEAGVDPDYTGETESYFTRPLFKAAVKDSDEPRPDITMVKLLLARGANPNLRDSSGMTPLIWHVSATWLNNHQLDPAIVEALIAGGADVNLTSPDGRTALSYRHDRLGSGLDSDTISQLLKRAGARLGTTCAGWREYQENVRKHNELNSALNEDIDSFNADANEGNMSESEFYRRRNELTERQEGLRNMLGKYQVYAKLPKDKSGDFARSCASYSGFDIF